MGRIFGILFVVLCVWTGVEVYSEGTSGAFGGLLVALGLVAEEPEGAAPVSERAASAWQDAYRASEDRVERQLE